MCRVSDKLKLCTCATRIAKLKHYWVLHRFSKTKDLMVIGETILPADISAEDDQFNRDTLVRLLNDGNVFDVDLKLSDKDRLQLTFTVRDVSSGDNAQIDYGFEYLNSRWEMIEFDGLEWMWRHNKKQHGKIENAME